MILLYEVRQQQQQTVVGYRSGITKLVYIYYDRTLHTYLYLKPQHTYILVRTVFFFAAADDSEGGVHPARRSFCGA